MYQRILVPVDGSPTSGRGLDEAVRLAQLTHGRLRLIHVVDELSFALTMDAYSGHAGDWVTVLRQNGSRILDAAAATVRAAGVEVDTVMQDNFSARLPDAVTTEAGNWQADLIVLGTHGRRGVGRLVMGSGAESVLRCSPVPVLLVRVPEAATSVEAPPQNMRVSLPSAALGFE
jgi:nucleotide-binding universal stress UspA family protein